MYTCTHTYTCIYIYICIYVHMCVYIYIYIYILTYCSVFCSNMDAESVKRDETPWSIYDGPLRPISLLTLRISEGLTQAQS